MHPKISSRLIILSLIAVLICAFSGCARKEEPADLVLTNGQIVTMDESIPQAEALAVRGDRIVAVGDQKRIKRFIGQATQVIDLDGKLAVPGFIDSHGHYTSLGQSKVALDLTKAKNWDEIVALVRAAAEKAEPGEWIIGRGWHQEKWDKTPEPQVIGLPFHTDLSQATPHNPVLLTHASGHSCLANAKAMELAGITRKTPDPPGGQIVRDDKGNPIGAFLETAQGLVRRALGEYRVGLTSEKIMSEQKRVITLAAKECLANGVTSFYDAGSSFETIDLFSCLLYTSDAAANREV